MGEFAPEIGLVIRHAYLWWNEARAGREEGAKDRPCVIVHTRRNEHGEIEVYIAPVTHSPPESPERAMEIPPATKKRLRLDDEKSWIITTELNQFIWPSPDLRPTAAGEYVYGYLPEKLMRLVLESVKKNARDKRLKAVPRTD